MMDIIPLVIFIAACFIYTWPKKVGLLHIFGALAGFAWFVTRIFQHLVG